MERADEEMILIAGSDEPFMGEPVHVDLRIARLPEHASELQGRTAGVNQDAGRSIQVVHTFVSCLQPYALRC